MSLRRRLMLIGAVIWAVLALAWFLDAGVLGKSAGLGWLAFVLAVLPLMLVFEILIVLRERLMEMWKRRKPDA